MLLPSEITTLGPRICIIGPSSSGKSSLAVALGAKLGIKVVHLDLLAHYPNTQWQARPKSELVALHDVELKDETWVIEGNYGVCMPQRFARATAIIWLDLGRFGGLWRYLRRILRPAAQRKGVLPGSIERFNGLMVRYIMLDYPRKRSRYQAILDGYDVPLIRLSSMAELKALYTGWGL